ncbi:MAG: hypothetical protein WDM92_02475 [Caulobacteraceae bacterium]
MPFFGFIATPRAHVEATTVMMRRGVRYALVGLGLLIMLAGVPLAVLPGHVGVLLMAIGLVIVLRNSFSARRHFIRAQRRHPKIVFPIRRLIRREPEVLPVAWQQSLRFERWVLPRRMRFMAKARRSIFRRKRR